MTMHTLYTTTTMSDGNQDGIVTVVHNSLASVAECLIDNFGEPDERYQYTETPEGIDGLIRELQEFNQSVLMTWDVHRVDLP